MLAIVVAAKEFRATLADEKEQGEDRSARAKNPKADKTSKPRKGTKEGKGASNPMYMYARTLYSRTALIAAARIRFALG